MFGWKPKESSIPSLIYPKLFSYLLALSYIISRSKLVLSEAEQCPHSAPTTKVQRYDFIQSEHEAKYRIPSFVTPKRPAPAVARPPPMTFWKGLGGNDVDCHGIYPKLMSSGRKG